MWDSVLSHAQLLRIMGNEIVSVDVVIFIYLVKKNSSMWSIGVLCFSSVSFVHPWIEK